MVLLVDERTGLHGGPGLHALVVGVSDYPHLPGGSKAGGQAAVRGLGMRPLSSAALTGYRIAQWLLERRHRLPVPLATCRVLLAPSDAERAAEPALGDLADPPTLARFIEEAELWRADACAHRDGVTLFYFAGHGVQRIRRDHVMLLADFGAAGGGLLGKAVDTTQLVGGMAPTPSQPDIARTQLYFVDACRIRPAVFHKYEALNTPPLWDVEVDDLGDRVAPVLFTAVPGTKAFAHKGKQTIFSQALLECLNGGAGLALGEDGFGRRQWGVTIHSLVGALNYHMDRVNRKAGTKQRFDLEGGGSGTQRLIHRLDGPPEVDVTLELDPAAALGCTAVKVFDLERNESDETPPEPVWDLKTVAPHPYRARLPAGHYRARAQISPATPPYADSNRTFWAPPPSHDVKVHVAPAAPAQSSTSTGGA